MPNTSQQSRAPGEQFELVLRIQQSRGITSLADAAEVRSRAQSLVRDTLISRLEMGPEVDAQDYVHTRGFSDAGKALAASRALQVAFEGFRSALPAARANVSMVLDSFAEDTHSAQQGPSVEQKDLLEAAKPSQVLVTQAFYDQVAQYQPAFRSFPAHAGVYEFLWSSEQRLNELQAEAEFMPTLVIETGSPAAVNLVAEQPVVADSEVNAAEGTWRPRQQRVDDDQEPRVSRLRIIAMSSAAVVLIGIGSGYLVTSHTTGGRPAKVATMASPAPVAPAPVAPPSAAPVAPPQEVASKPAPATKAVVPQHRAIAPPPDSPKPAGRVRECAISGLIPNYLNLAENNRIKGQYEAAIREYGEVLSCEPNNREARDGMLRTKDAERLRAPRQ